MPWKTKLKSKNQIKSQLGLDEKGKLQSFFDLTVATRLQPYVTRDEGTQEESILTGTDPGSGKVNINVPYAEYQAYSPNVRKHDPKDKKRGKRPFERMTHNEKNVIAKELNDYARRLSDE